jgi:HK97 family phage prohead protease
MKPKKQKKVKRTKSTRPGIEVRAGKPETRSYKSTRLEVRKAADGSMELVGTAIVFGSESQDLGGFVEICSYEAVQKSLARNDDVFMLWQHDTSQPLSRTKTGTLKLSLNRAGLDFTATLPNSPLGQNAFQAIKNGTVDSVSFGFNIEPDGDEWVMQGDSVVRILRDINVKEISPVTWAAYLAPHVDCRSCPASLRSKLKRSDDDDDDDDDVCNPASPDYDPDACDDDEEDRCECDCQNCLDGNCDECTNPECDDADCLDDDCPAQITRTAHMELLLRRLRA